MIVTRTYFQENIIKHENCQGESQVPKFLCKNQIIDLDRLLKKILKKGEYIAIKYHDTPDDNDSRSCKITLPYYGGGSSKE